MSIRLAGALFVLASLPVGTCIADLTPKSLEGTEDLRMLMSEATVACRGEVLDAPKAKFVDGTPQRKTGIATVRIDKCYKGTAPSQVNVAVDEFLPGGGTSGEPRFVILKSGEYDLFFFTRKGNVFLPLDKRNSVITISRESSNTAKPSDPLAALEGDLVAGLQDGDHELVLKSILLLGGLGHLTSTAPLKKRIAEADEIERDYLWEALLRVKDYSNLPQVAEYLHNISPPPRTLMLPRDRLPQVQNRLFGRLFEIKDLAASRFQKWFVKSSDAYIRQCALQALRAEVSVQNAPQFLDALTDQDFDNRFISMMALIELAGGGDIPWIRPYEEMRDAPEFYSAKCREWWWAEGNQKARLRSASSIPQ